MVMMVSYKDYRSELKVVIYLGGLYPFLHLINIQLLLEKALGIVFFVFFIHYMSLVLGGRYFKTCEGDRRYKFWRSSILLTPIFVHVYFSIYALVEYRSLNAFMIMLFLSIWTGLAAWSIRVKDNPRSASISSAITDVSVYGAVLAPVFLAMFSEESMIKFLHIWGNFLFSCVFIVIFIKWTRRGFLNGSDKWGQTP